MDSPRRFDPGAESVKYQRIGNIIRDAAQFHGRGFILTGLLLLLATPLFRVAFFILAFLRRRDYAFVFITLWVLSLLLYSFVISGWR